MSELKDFTQQDLINLQKVMSIEKKNDVAYEYNGKIYSCNQRKETAYLIKMDNSTKLYVFNNKNKLVARIIVPVGTISI